MSNSTPSDTTDDGGGGSGSWYGKRGGAGGSSSRLEEEDKDRESNNGTTTHQPHQNNNMMMSFILRAVEKKSVEPVVVTNSGGNGGGGGPVTGSHYQQPIQTRGEREREREGEGGKLRTVHSSSLFANRTGGRPDPIEVIGMGQGEVDRSHLGTRLLSPALPISPTTQTRPTVRGTTTTHHYPLPASTEPHTHSHPTNLLSTSFNPPLRSKETPPSIVEPDHPRVGRDAFFANGPLNAIAASPNQEQVAVAGREVLKILDITPDEIEESLNLRVAYRQNLNFSSADVDWGVGYCRDRLATATTSGSVVVWDLNKSGHKIERLITEHTRAVHRVKFHPSTGTTLFSASQDGTLKAWDVRTKDPARITFYPKAEAVRDFRFNPLYPEEFVAAFDNGSIQMWDIRQPNQYIKKLTAHSGPTLAVDWHHDGRTVASGGRDKLVKIWDMKSDSRKPTGLIQTIAPVASVRWRPHHGYQIATTSLSTDYTVNVWDTHRPFIPRYSVIGHSNVTTDIYWASQDVLWSSSKDQHFLRRRLDRGERQGAKEPIFYLPTSGISWNSYGDLGFVIDRPSQTAGLPPRPSPSIDPRAERRRALASRLNLSSSFDKNFRISPTQTGGILHLPAFDYPSFVYLALNYSSDFHDPMLATETNFRVAYETGHFRTAQTWKIIQLICCKFVAIKETVKDPVKHSSKSNAKEPPPLDIPTPIVHPMVTKAAADGASQYPTSGSSIHSYPRQCPPDTDEPIELDEWLEGIQIYDTASDSSDEPRPPRRFSSSTTPGRKWDPSADPSTRLSLTPLTLSDHQGDSSSPLSSSPSSPLMTDRFPHDWDYSQLIQELLTYYADEGDVQMCSFVVLLLGEQLQIPRQQSEQWLHAYVELLRRFKLWEPATAILNACHHPELIAQNQDSTTFYTLCPRCRRPLLPTPDVPTDGYWGCQKCRKVLDPCGICHRRVQGVYAWCQGCGHGGHLPCLTNWFNPSHPVPHHQPPTCPTGCGHACSITLG